MKLLKSKETEVSPASEADTQVREELGVLRAKYDDLESELNTMKERLHFFDPKVFHPSRRQHEENRRRARGEVFARGRPRGPTIVVPALPTCGGESVWLHDQRLGVCHNCSDRIGEVRGWERSFLRANEVLLRDHPEVRQELDARIAAYRKAGTIP